jgi:hypothetical protein
LRKRYERGFSNGFLTRGVWHYSWPNRLAFATKIIFHKHQSHLMLILGVALGLFILGGGLISVTNALSKRQ